MLLITNGGHIFYNELSTLVFSCMSLISSNASYNI